KFSSGTGVTGSAIQDCSAGYYCTGGATVPTQFESQPGHFSLAGAFHQTPCSPGQYQPAKLSSKCLTCTQGYFCAGVGTFLPKISPIGFYAPLGSEVGIPCPIGTYLDETGKYLLSHCKSCTAGKACTKVGLSIPDIDCSVGYYCLTGAKEAYPIDGISGNLCKEGYFCPAGSKTFSDNPCPLGTYSNRIGNKAAIDCIDCDPGMYCGSLALKTVTGPCNAGYYCKLKATKKNPEDGGVTGDLCPKNRICPAGTSIPIKCPE
ncbi:hypothetical protein A3Q56_08531, partial [Intoshia linei]